VKDKMIVNQEGAKTSLNPFNTILKPKEREKEIIFESQIIALSNV